MRNCNDTCRPGFVPGPPAPNYTSGCTLEQNPTFKTYTLPASVGTDEAGQPYAPRIGEFTNAIVIYEANGNIYIYDSLGTPTLIEKGDYNNAGGAITGPKVVQGAGDSTSEVMSQKAVSYEFERVAATTSGQGELLTTLNNMVSALADKVARLEAKMNAKELEA